MFIGSSFASRETFFSYSLFFLSFLVEVKSEDEAFPLEEIEKLYDTNYCLFTCI